MAAAAKEITDHPALSESPPDSPVRKSRKWRYERRTEDLTRKRDHSIERLARVEDMSRRSEALKAEIEKERALAAERAAAAQKALDQDKKNSSGWTWWR